MESSFLLWQKLIFVFMPTVFSTVDKLLFLLLLLSCSAESNSWQPAPSVSSVAGIFQARILEWVATPSSMGSSQPRARTMVSSIAGGFWQLHYQGSPCCFCDVQNLNTCEFRSQSMLNTSQKVAKTRIKRKKKDSFVYFC